MPALATYEGPSCPHCRAPLELDAVLDGSQECTSCFRGFEAVRFQPAVRRQRVAEVGAGGPDEAASCAAHRRNAAVASCERCGIFMCTLCRTECDGMTICAPCFERLAQQGALHSAATEYRNYVGMAWLCGLLGILPCLVGLVTGPVAIYCAMRGLRQMGEWGDVGGRGRAVGALALGVLGSIVNGVTVAALFS
jgi:hypothetical protein